MKKAAKKKIIIAVVIILGAVALLTVGYLLYLLFTVVIPLAPGLLYAFFK